MDELISNKSREDSSIDLEMRAILEFAGPHNLRQSWEGSSLRKFRPSTTITPCLQLDPAIWSRLLEEVLEVVFAKLTVPEIHGLRCLSTSWNHNLVEIKSAFIELCKKTSARMVALIYEDEDEDEDDYSYKQFWVKLFDTGTNKWHVYKLLIKPFFEKTLHLMSATDGGLLCFLYADADRYETDEGPSPLHVVVYNPLTRHVKTLVLERLSMVMVLLLQIDMNRNTRHYKISIMWHKGDWNPHSHNVVDTFDSKTDEWTSLDVPSDYSWNLLHLRKLGITACGTGRVHLTKHELDNISGIQKAHMEDYVLLRDRLFVLHKEKKMCFIGDTNNATMPNTFMDYKYWILEYQCETHQQENWMRLRTITCKRFELSPSTTVNRVQLNTCEGFLYVVPFNDKWSSTNHINHQSGWLYNLSTNKWIAAPSIPGGNEDLLLCELHWDVDPNLLKVPNKVDQFSFPIVNALNNKS